MKAVTLDEKEERAFATAASRFAKEGQPPAPITAAQVIEARR
jgi:hypothetical protein